MLHNTLQLQHPIFLLYRIVSCFLNFSLVSVLLWVVQGPSGIDFIHIFNILLLFSA